MKNENLILFGILAVGIYFYYDKKKKDQLKPYSEDELKIVLNNFISKYISETEVLTGEKVPVTTENFVIELTNDISNAKQQGRDVSRANVNKFLSILKKTTLYQLGSTANGVPTKEEQDFFYNFRSVPQPKYQPKEVEVATVPQTKKNGVELPSNELPVKFAEFTIAPVRRIYSELKEGLLEPKVIKLIPKK